MLCSGVGPSNEHIQKQDVKHRIEKDLPDTSSQTSLG